MDPTMQPSEFIDAIPLLESALAELSKGQLVRDERYGMMDLMSAIEINDGRTDTFLHAQKERQARSADLPPFNPSVELSAEELLWVHDELLRLEATFRDGHPLSSTLWTCNLLRPPSLAALCDPGRSAPGPSVEEDYLRPTDLRTVVLRALLLGTLKTSEIMWEETGKAQLYEHEDVHLSLSTLSFNSLMSACYPPATPSPPLPADPLRADPPSRQVQERTVSVDDVLRDLDEALQWVQEAQASGADWAEDEKVLDQLRFRLMMRIDLLYATALLTFPAHTSPRTITHHLDRLIAYCSAFPSASETPSSVFTPSPALRAFFLPSASIPLLATQQPPRPVTSMSVGEAYDQLRNMASDLKGLMSFWSAWIEGDAVWKDLAEWTRERGRKASVPYMRSIQQSVIASPTHLFSVSNHLHLSLSFLRIFVPLSPTHLNTLFSTLLSLRSTETDPSQLAHKAIGFFERLASEFLIKSSVHLCGQNRGRQRRLAIKSLRGWLELAREADEQVVPLLKSLLPSLPLDVAGRQELEHGLQSISKAIEVQSMLIALEALMSGLEEHVGLFDAEEEKRQAWWTGGRLAAHLATLLTDLETAGVARWEGVEYVEAKQLEAKAVRHMCEASFLMIMILPVTPAPPKFSNPFLADLAIPPRNAARGRFLQRFSWLDVLPQPKSEELADWGAYEMAVGEARSTTPGQLAETAAKAYGAAVAALTAGATIPLAERGVAVQPEPSLRRLAALRRTAIANQNRLSSLTRSHDETTATDAGEKARRTTMKWDAAWFPCWMEAQQ
ncbi:RHTO0S07e00496g1_1 [Rhodotorula toruloides]|uniref:RHTO0S07e00496g1_1 n=1 Tax=Rhodotorula toruloides TaxID=5286 RepID=A0A061AYE3_RHOTO|nr:RHTO0S07e00496g1_1 [Rhodotorula toruloides]